MRAAILAVALILCAWVIRRWQVRPYYASKLFSSEDGWIPWEKGWVVYRRTGARSSNGRRSVKATGTSAATPNGRSTS